MTTDQVLAAAVVVVLLVLVLVGAFRVATRRRGANEDEFGAGGLTRVPLGTTGSVRTALAPSGVVDLLGEQWTGRSRTGEAIAPGSGVVVVGHDGLALIVDRAPDAQPATE
jgi:membrane-bound ClpP family serine protease